MKTFHYYFSPIYGKLCGRQICYFYTTWWLQGSRNYTPNGEYWKAIYLPASYDRGVDLKKESFRSEEKLIYLRKVISCICLMKFLTEDSIIREPIIIKVHGVYASDMLENSMDFLVRINQFRDMMFSPSATQEGSILPTTSRMRHAPGYDIFRVLRDPEFDFVMNVLYDSGLFQKIFQSVCGGDSIISIKYANTNTRNHLDHSAFTRFRSDEIYREKIKKTDRNVRIIRPVEFRDFINLNK